MIEQKNGQVTDAHTVAQAVRKHLPAQLSNGIVLEIVEPGIRREEHWWSVPIRPSVEPTRRYEFYEVLAEAEEDMDEEEHLKVLLVPADPATGA